MAAEEASTLASWVRNMSLDDQIYLTGTALLLGGIRERRAESLPFPFSETRLTSSRTPEEAARSAREIAEAYATAPPFAGPDGVDEHWRIAAMTREVAARIENAYPTTRSR
jgi:hypothetical protein